MADLPEKSTLARFDVKNPLGILALFISFIYSMSALILGVRADTLTDLNESVLIWFVALFPVLILAAFVWLVARHHTKLYSPQDYRSDEGFLGTADPKDLGRRLQEEVNQARHDDEPTPGPANESGTPAASSEEETDVRTNAEPKEGKVPNPSPVETAVSRAFLAEGLVFQELQQEFNWPIRRHVRLQSAMSNQPIEVDGIIEGPSERIAVEVKHIAKPWRVSNQLNAAVRQLERLKTANIPTLPPMRMLVAMVAEDAKAAKIIESHALAMGMPSSTFRVFILPNLLEKYGLGARFE